MTLYAVAVYAVTAWAAGTTHRARAWGTATGWALARVFGGIEQPWP